MKVTYLVKRPRAWLYDFRGSHTELLYHKKRAIIWPCIFCPVHFCGGHQQSAVQKWIQVSSMGVIPVTPNGSETTAFLANRVLLMDKILQHLGCMNFKKPWHTCINSSSENPLVSNRISIYTDMIAAPACFKTNSKFEREPSVPVPSTDCWWLKSCNTLDARKLQLIIKLTTHQDFGHG